MSEEKMVETISGQVAPIAKCRKFGNAYYLIGDINVENSGDCYEIDGQFNRIEVGRIIYDNHLKRYVTKNDKLYHGLIGLNENVPVFGAFSANDDTNGVAVLEGKNHVRVMDMSIFEGSKIYRERLADGKFYHVSTLNAAEFNRISPPTNDYKTSLPYDASQVLDVNIAKYESLDVKILPNVEKYAPFLKELSFGLEFETIAGTIPQKILNNTGLIPLRDGSIQGIEYVTVPMTGAKGLQTTLNAVSELSCRTKYDNSCALHMHIGNIPRTPEFILAFFKVTCAIQDELYSMFPLYKKYNFGVKAKNYTQPFPAIELLSQMNPIIDSSNIKQNFNLIYQYLSMGESFYDRDCDLRNVVSHPADRDGRQKWHIRTRYHIHNLIPLIFGNKQTIEFRIHTATLDVNKVSFFMMMNAAIVNFTIEHTSKILKDPTFMTLQGFGLNEIIQGQANIAFKDCRASDHFVDSFCNYLNIRKKHTEQDNCAGRIIGDENDLPTPKRIDWLKAVVEEKSQAKMSAGQRTFRKEYEQKFGRLEVDHVRGRIDKRTFDDMRATLLRNYIRTAGNQAEVIFGDLMHTEAW